MKELLLWLSSIHPLSAELRFHLESILQVRELRKKEFLLRADQVCKHITFVQKGLFRCFYLNEDKEISSWFMKEGDVIASVESFFKQRPSYESIQALEDSEVYYISYKDLQHIYHTYPEFNFIGRVLVEKYYCLCDQRLYSLKMKRARDRYKHLLEHYPALIQRVPSIYLASYLAITVETLSRIKSKK